MAEPQTRWQSWLSTLNRVNDRIEPFTQGAANPLLPLLGLGVKYLNAPVTPPEEAPPPAVGDVFGFSSASAPAARTSTPRQSNLDAIFNSLIQQESGGRPGVLGPETRYGRAEGMTQMLPATARETAERNGIPWRPELMRDTSAEAAEYQRQLGRLYFEQGLRETGSVEGALMYYHGGPNRELWGPKTRRYAQEVLERAGGGSAGGSLIDQIISSGQSAGQGIFESIDPRVAASLVPDPMMLQGVTLPDAPQRALPQDLPQHEIVSRAILDELRAASQMPERDRSQDAWDRFQALLAGAAGGAVQAGDMTLGGQIAAAGAGGLNAFRGEREGQRALDREQDLMQQQLNIALAQAGIDVDLQGIAGRNANLDRGWQSGENRADTVFGNDMARFNRDLQQSNMDFGVRQYNTGAVNDTRRARGQVALSALEGQANARNQGTQLGIQLAAAAREQAADPRRAEQTIRSALASAGVPENDTTLGVARAITARNPNAVMPYLAQSVLTSGMWQTLLAEEDAQQVERYSRNEDTLPMALAIVQRALAATAQQPNGQELLQGVVDDLNAQGDPVGILLRGARAGQ